MSHDWTALDGVSNSSVAYVRIAQSVEHVIRGSGVDLINGHAEAVARVIVSRIICDYGFGPPAGHVSPEQRVRLVTLTAESIRLISDPKFRKWAEANEHTREKHNGEIELGGDNHQTLDWMQNYALGVFGKVCQLDVTQMQDAMEVAGFAVQGFVADGSWGDFSTASLENVRDAGHQLWNSRYCTGCGAEMNSAHHKDVCETTVGAGVASPNETCSKCGAENVVRNGDCRRCLSCGNSVGCS